MVILGIILMSEQVAHGQSPLQSLRKKIEHYSFNFEDIIGKGYSSQVYRGKNDESEQVVAIKVIDMGKIKSEFNRDLLHSEIEILKLFKSYENILSVQNVYTTRNNTYIISELCTSDLHKFIKKKTKLSEYQSMNYMVQILQAYRHLYQFGIVHRDLKPANMLVDNAQTIKIADFGFAIKLEKLKNPCSYNVGSPLYMSPEALGKSQYSFKSDIWALGVIFFEMLTGTTPWQAKYEKDLLKKIQQEQIPQKLQKQEFQNQSINEFIRACLTKNINERISPQQLLKFRDVFAAICSRQPIKKAPSLKHVPILQTSLILRNEKMQAIAGKNQYVTGRCLRTAAIWPQRDLSQCKGADNRNTNCHSKSKSVQFKKIPSHNNITIINTRNPQQAKLPSNRRLKTAVESTDSPIIAKPPGATDIPLAEEKKVINKIFLCQIHFCRFMYKLTVRMRKCVQNAYIVYCAEDVQSLLTSYTRIIRTKLEKVKSFQRENFLNAINYEQYIQSKSYANVLRLCNQYLGKYQRDLTLFWNPDDRQGQTTVETKTTIQSVKAILKAVHQQIPTKVLFEDKYSDDIIILDYLMTCKQLLDLAEGDNYTRFSKKSRIQQIVEGFSTKITYDLYCKIKRKAEIMLQQNC